jgi:hypothetical protein
MLHIHCGDSSADSLRAAGVAAEVMVWSDLLYIGPLPHHVPPMLWHAVRARALSKELGGAVPCVRLEQRLQRMDEAQARWQEHNEVVLWFDACLYDQTILVRQLDWFGQRNRQRTMLSLICAGEFPGIDNYHGLGQLSPEQLVSLLDTRHAVTDRQLELAARAWRALCAESPHAVAELLDADTTALPYLHDALRRHLEELPATANGLSRLESEALRAVAAGAHSLVDIFRAVSGMEPRPYFGDTSLWGCLDDLAQADTPALTVAGPGRLPRWQPPQDLSPWSITLTPFGEQLLAGEADWVATNGVDRWVGNAHVSGREGVWRWDAGGHVISRQ